jgi:hypothetical protein
MRHIDRLKNIWTVIYDPKIDVTGVIEDFFHPDYEQTINGVMMCRSEYINHVIAQKKSMVMKHIEFKHYLESGEELFAIYCAKGKSSEGSDIEAEIVSYFQFQDKQILKIHGQVRLIKGEYLDVDMHSRR